MQGDLAAAHVEHLQHFPFIGDGVDGDYQHHEEADDCEGHDGQDDTRIRLLKAIYVQTCNCTSRENYVKVKVPECCILSSKFSDQVERHQAQEQQPGAEPHLQRHFDEAKGSTSRRAPTS